MADTLEEILNQSYTVDSFTNNSLTLLSTDSSTRYVIKDIYVNTDNAATLENLKLYSNGFLLGNFLYGGSGSEIIGTSGNLTLQSDGLTDYYASAYDLRFSIARNTNTDYYDMTIPYIKNTLVSSSIPSVSSSLITTGQTSASSTRNYFMIYPDFTSGSTAYYFWNFDSSDVDSPMTIDFYQDVTNGSPNYTNTTSYMPWTTIPSIPQYVYSRNSSSNIGLDWWTFNSTPGGAYVKGDVSDPANATGTYETSGWFRTYARMYPIADSTGNWNGGAIFKYGGNNNNDYRTAYLIRFLTPTSLRSFHKIQYTADSSLSYAGVGGPASTVYYSNYSFAGEFDTDFESGETPYFILVGHDFSNNDRLHVFKVYFTETAVGNNTSVVPNNVIEGSGSNIEFIKTIYLTGDNALKSTYVQNFLYKNEFYYISYDNSLKSVNWKTESITTIASGLSVLYQSMAVPQLQIPSQSTMNSRGYNTITSFDLRITGIKSL